MKAARIPIVLVVAALLAGGAMASRWRLEPPSSAGLTAIAELDRWLPSVPGAEAGGSTWYCVAGTAAGTGGLAEQTIVTTNVGDRPAQVRLSAVSGTDAPVVRTFELPARTRIDTVLSEVLTADTAAALVEVTGGQVAVSHVLRGRLATTQGPCATSPATRWLFPAGTTRPLAREILAVFNPFPDVAVLDVAFVANDGKRTPEDLQGKVVQPGELVNLEITDIVPDRESLTTDLVVRSGRVVAERLQIFDPESGVSLRSEEGNVTTTADPGPEGTSGTAAPTTTRVPVDAAARSFSGPGTSADLGTPVAAVSWVFPGTPARSEQTRTEYVLYNPGTEAADAVVAVELDPDAPGEPAPSVEPFTVTVRAGQYVSVPLDGDDRVPTGRRHTELVFTTNDVPIVAERFVRRLPDGPDAGLDLSLGSPVGATDWVLPAATIDGARSSLVTIVNPGAAAVRVDVAVVRAGDAGLLAGGDDVEIAPRTSLALDLGGIDDTAPAGALVRATGPVVVAQELTVGDPGTVSTSLAIPVAATLGRLAVPDLTEGLLEGGELDFVPGSTIPVVTAPPGSEVLDPGTTEGTDGVAPDSTDATTPESTGASTETSAPPPP